MLAESVLFGRFSLVLLSWVRTSSFLQERENCSFSGSVAQRKAYFEKYYKILAKKKAFEQAFAGLKVRINKEWIM